MEREFEMLDSENKNDIVDTTDCLEAMNACRGMKNFLFTIMLICLVVLQVCFWLDRAGFVSRTEPYCAACETCESDVCPAVTANDDNIVRGVDFANYWSGAPVAEGQMLATA